MTSSKSMKSGIYGRVILIKRAGSLPFAWLLTILLLSGVCEPVFSQVEAEGDTLEVAPIRGERQVLNQDAIDRAEIIPTSKYSPRRAALLSAALPGLGQAYTKSYWKIPVIYGGFAMLAYFVDFNNERYNTFRKGLFRLLNDPSQNTVTLYGLRFTENSLRRNIDNDRRNRDYLIILSGVLYLLNIADAMVDAHLKEFDLNKNLSLQLKPAMNHHPSEVSYTGLAITLNLK